MRHRIPGLVWIIALYFTISVSVCAQSQPTSSQPKSAAQSKTRDERSPTIFVFHTDEFWLNLHHFLYVLGRAENKETDAAREAVVDAPRDQERGLEKLSEKDRKIWREIVTTYATGTSKQDIVFNEPLPALTHALARAADAESLKQSEIYPVVANALELAAPIYRKAWWPKHREANRSWHKATQTLVEQHGAQVLAFITNAYKLEWPAAGFPVHVSAYTNWAGAYSTRGDLLVVSSLSPNNQGAYALETVFHEGMHQWDREVFEALRQQAIKLNKFFPRGLSHGLVFFTAGEAIRRVVPGHVRQADMIGIWQRGLRQFKVPLEEIWKPYLDGKGTREEAFAELIKRTAVEPPKKE